MAGRWALLIAIDKPLHAAFGACPYAEAAMKSLAAALTTAGWPAETQFVQLGPFATKAAIDSRLRTLKKSLRKGDELLIAFAGSGFARNGESVLACWDTLPDDLADTAFSVRELLSSVQAKALQITVLLDVGTGPPVAEFASHLDSHELAKLFADSPNAVALVATEPGEESHRCPALKSSAWLHLIAEGIAGREPKAFAENRSVTAVSLHRFVCGELPRILGKHFDTDAEQTPTLFGEQNGGFVLADFSAANASSDSLDAGRLRRVVFRSSSTGRVKDLSGFRKSFTVPENASAYNRKFVARLAVDDLKADLEAVFIAARDSLGYKRKDVMVSADSEGFGFFRGPDFEYTVTVALDPDDPSQVLWKREAGQFADAAFLRGNGFENVFGKLFDELDFEFATPIDVSAIVDRLEDRPPPGVRVHAASDGATCDLTLSGFTGRISLTRQRLTIHGRAGRATGLLDQFLRFIGAVGPLGEPLALPGKRSS